MKKVAKIVLIVFVVILEVGYADNCRKELFEKYKAHSAELIRLKNKCKPLFEKVARLADTYKNTVEYKEYEVIKNSYLSIYSKWLNSSEYAEAMKKRQSQCESSSPEGIAYSKRLQELWHINAKTQAYRAFKQAQEELDIEIDATCSLFSSGVYDVEKAFERIAKAEHKVEKAGEAWQKTPQNQAYERKKYEKSPYSMFGCREVENLAERKYFAAYRKVLETAKKALEPLQTAFRNSPEFEEYIAECRGITGAIEYEEFSIEAGQYEPRGIHSNWGWENNLEESTIIYYIGSTIANRP